jgi:Zn-dependent protease with chaperone function
VAWPLLVTIRLFVMPMQAAGSRAAEYRADQAAVAAGLGRGLRRVLSRLRASFDGARNGWELSLCNTHPPNELRLERLEEPGVRYPLPDADAPAHPLPVVLASSLTRD